MCKYIGEFQQKVVYSKMSHIPIAEKHTQYILCDASYDSTASSSLAVIIHN